MGSSDCNNIPKEPAALLLVDVQNSFFHPSGANYYKAVEEIIDNLQRLLECARSSASVIIHVREWHRPDTDDFEQRKLPEHCIRGSHDAEFFEGFGPANGNNEFLINKRRLSAFFATDLDLLLREQGISRLVIAGCKANVCIRATVQDAFSLGYTCLVPRSAVNSNRPALADAALEDIDRYMGWVVAQDVAEVALS